MNRSSLPFLVCLFFGMAGNAMSQNEPYRGGIGKGDAQGAGVLADLNGVQPNRWVGGAVGNVNRWLTAANWSRGVIPDSTENVWIPLRPNQPRISSSVPGTVLRWNRRVVVDNNAIVTLDSGPLLRVDALGSLETNGLGRLVLEPGARLRNIGEAKPLLEVKQRLVGAKGWRLLSSPVGTTFGDWLDSLETSGYSGSAYPTLQPNVLWFAETDTGTTNQNWRLPPSANDSVVAGRGYFAYVFGGAARPSGAPVGNFGDTLPLVLTAIGRDNGPVGAGSFVFGTTFTPRSLSTAADTVGGNRFFLDEGVADEGWNLLGNPTAGTLNWDIPGAWSKGNIHNTIYIWDPNFGNGSGGYRYWNGALGNVDTSLGSGLLAPYQAFWVHASASNPVLSFNSSAFSESPSTMVGRTGSTEPPPHVRVQIDGEDMQATAFVSFGPDGIFGPDLNDAYQLESYSDRWLMLYSQSSPQHQKPLVINHLPDNLLEETAIPLQVSAAGDGVSHKARYRLSWTLSENWPSHWTLALMDHNRQQVIPMQSVQSYDFVYESNALAGTDGDGAESSFKTPKEVLHRSASSLPVMQNARGPQRPFTVVVLPFHGNGPVAYRPDHPHLYPPSPNPFAGETYLSFYLPQAGPATLEVLDPLGRLVARESYDRYRAGTQQRLWDARELPAGSYIVRLVTPEHISTQRVIHR